MVLKSGSVAALVIAVLAILFLVNRGYVFSLNPVTIIVQVLAATLMIWARITFGIRSFHASANTTKGALVTTGPYRWFRHPIYAAVIYFFWASAIAYPFIETIAASTIITIALFVRMILEEKFLKETYEEYSAYSKRTKRILPFLF
jgi:protein-S-isoprenylcysteine O-methyltransferase Ste14